MSGAWAGEIALATDTEPGPDAVWCDGADVNVSWCAPDVECVG